MSLWLHLGTIIIGSIAIVWTIATSQSVDVAPTLTLSKVILKDDKQNQRFFARASLHFHARAKDLFDAKKYSLAKCKALTVKATAGLIAIICIEFWESGINSFFDGLGLKIQLESRMSFLIEIAMFVFLILGFSGKANIITVLRGVIHLVVKANQLRLSLFDFSELLDISSKSVDIDRMIAKHFPDGE